MLLKTILNRVQKFKSFLYKSVRWVDDDQALEIELAERANGQALWQGLPGLRSAGAAALGVCTAVGPESVSRVRPAAGAVC
jgi:hypothetical protein